MFFSKEPFKQDKKIAVIGTSPLAFFLSSTFVENGYDIRHLVPLDKLDTFSHLGALTIKSSLYKNHRQEILFDSELNSPVDFCFLASTPENCRTDILFLLSPFLKEAQIINFSSFYNQDLFKELKHLDETRAFFKGWINFDKGTLQPLEKQSQIILETPLEKTSELKELFNNTPFSLSSTEGKNVFWQNLAAFFLSNLLLISSNHSMSKIFTDKKLRSLTDCAIKELCSLAEKEKISIDSSKVLADIYACPDNYKTEFTSRKSLYVLGQLIKGITPLATPSLQNLLSTALKKY